MYLYVYSCRCMHTHTHKHTNTHTHSHTLTHTHAPTREINGDRRIYLCTSLHPCVCVCIDMCRSRLRHGLRPIRPIRRLGRLGVATPVAAAMARSRPASPGADVAPVPVQMWPRRSARSVRHASIELLAEEVVDKPEAVRPHIAP